MATRFDSTPRCHLDIGNGVFVTAKTWKGDELHIHIRKYENDKERSFPTERGIKINLMQWLELKTGASHVDETISLLKQRKDKKIFYHLGANTYVQVDTKFAGVDIRHWWWCCEDKVVKPSKKGIFLRLDQWEKLKECFGVMVDYVPELETTVPCIMQEDHQNQVGALRCTFCNPNHYMNW
ncbi:uncharacterized protein LOC124152515 [Haliotis rufescens]|uniref:uncharacterized protein LOC124152515 n=1 Tax=Haliotis rufescens TaxID=6454 RepID=UPI00201F45A9|nr:uncharacterized protein LOC124152515 [Haliotis rufescens]